MFQGICENPANYLGFTIECDPIFFHRKFGFPQVTPLHLFFSSVSILLSWVVISKLQKRYISFRKISSGPI